MPSWNKILENIETSRDKFALDTIRQDYLKQLSKVTGRHTIAYYSGWLQNQNNPSLGIDDLDKNAFMAVIYSMENKKEKGLDLILHTPGGQVSAVESLIDYLHFMFSTNIRAIVPQIAMSGGTMLACACKEIMMGKHSNLGPIDPQFGSIPAVGVIDEFNSAVEGVKENPASTPLWQTLINKYPISFLGKCQQAIDWSEEIVKTALEKCMFKDTENPKEMASTVTTFLSSHKETKAHDRHITMEQCKKIGMKIIELEKVATTTNLKGINDNDFQDIVLSIHHCFMIAFSKNSGICKIVENQYGKNMINVVNVQH
jgi:hypothetical protein